MLKSLEFCSRVFKLVESAPRIIEVVKSQCFSTSSLAPSDVSSSFAPTADHPIYLDIQSTTPMDSRVLDVMLPYFTHHFGNPHSRTHSYGWNSEAGVEKARKHIANLIGADEREIIFTSGATESNNMSVKGVARFYKAKKKHIITSEVEHKCVLDSCRVLQEEGFDVTYLPVNQDGIIDLQLLKSSIRDDTSLVSFMAVNNEIGTIQPLAEIGKICRERKVFFHTDAAQAVGKIPIDVNALNVDLLSISGHKLYGPKGIGALYIRRKPRVRIEPLFSGGGQERGLRSGTVPTPLAVGLGEACRLSLEDMEHDVLAGVLSCLLIHECNHLSKDYAHISRLSKKLSDALLAIPHVKLNGSSVHHYPGCLNISFAYVEGESLLMALKEIALSSGSACTSASLEPSYVLRALGVEEDQAHSSIRFGIGRFTTEEEVDFVISRVERHVHRLREMSPLWEMIQEGVDLKSVQWSQH